MLRFISTFASPSAFTIGAIEGRPPSATMRERGAPVQGGASPSKESRKQVTTSASLCSAARTSTANS
ncbi:hypothetical protein D3C83_210130 [compost metagenome]